MVAGFAVVGGARHAFVSDPSTGTMTDLGTLSGDRSSDAYDVNSNGIVVGKSTDANGVDHAFMTHSVTPAPTTSAPATTAHMATTPSAIATAAKAVSATPTYTG